MSKREQDVKPDKGGDRGGRQGLGKMGSSHEGFGTGHVKQGYKKLQTVDLTQKSGYAPPSNTKKKTPSSPAQGKTS